MENDSRPLLISIVGPTAVGKTKMAISIANKYRTEIISADSRQFYRELKIGTAKPTEYELQQAKHHFINSLSIEDPYDVGLFEKQVLERLDTLFQQFRVVVMAGGSGLYCKAIWEGLDSFPAIPSEVREELLRELETKGLSTLLLELKEKDPGYFDIVDRNNPQRVVRALEVIRYTSETFMSFRNQGRRQRPFRNIKIGINLPREALYERIDERMDQMLEAGLLEEAKAFYDKRSLNALQTVGYSEVFGYLDGSYDQQEAIRLLKRNSRRYAKRQLTWFQKDEGIRWFEPDQQDSIFKEIESALNT